jgi:hypothetical protein
MPTTAGVWDNTALCHRAGIRQILGETLGRILPCQSERFSINGSLSRRQPNA